MRADVHLEGGERGVALGAVLARERPLDLVVGVQLLVLGEPRLRREGLLALRAVVRLVAAAAVVLELLLLVEREGLRRQRRHLLRMRGGGRLPVPLDLPERRRRRRAGGGERRGLQGGRLEGGGALGRREGRAHRQADRQGEGRVLREGRVGAAELGRGRGEVLRLQRGRRLLVQMLLVRPRERVSGVGPVGQLRRLQRAQRVQVRRWRRRGRDLRLGLRELGGGGGEGDGSERRLAEGQRAEDRRRQGELGRLVLPEAEQRRDHLRGRLRLPLRPLGGRGRRGGVVVRLVLQELLPVAHGRLLLLLVPPALLPGDDEGERLVVG